MKITQEDINRLKCAKDLLENPGIAAKLTNIIGMPFEKAFDYLPAKWTDAIQTITQKSLQHALDVAVKTIDHNDKKSSNDKLHKLLVIASVLAILLSIFIVVRALSARKSFDSSVSESPTAVIRNVPAGLRKENFRS